MPAIGKQQHIFMANTAHGSNWYSSKETNNSEYETVQEIPDNDTLSKIRAMEALGNTYTIINNDIDMKRYEPKTKRISLSGEYVSKNQRIRTYIKHQITPFGHKKQQKQTTNSHGKLLSSKENALQQVSKMGYVIAGKDKTTTSNKPNISHEVKRQLCIAGYSL
jgi:hypothetical protein